MFLSSITFWYCRVSISYFSAEYCLCLKCRVCLCTWNCRVYFITFPCRVWFRTITCRVLSSTKLLPSIIFSHQYHAKYVLNIILSSIWFVPRCRVSFWTWTCRVYLKILRLSSFYWTKIFCRVPLYFPNLSSIVF